MKPDLPKLLAHAEAVDALVVETINRNNALIEAQGTMVHYDRSPMREMALQGLARAIVRGQEAQSSLTTYARTLRTYTAEIERQSK